ncbi:MAG: PAS domain S-box protein [Promethearchaeota archaeon]
MEEVIQVLHVDDELSFLQITQKFMNIVGKGEINFHSLSEPLKVFEELKANDFDVIVTDYQMPGMDGLELLGKLKDLRIDIPVIIFTGRGREEVAINALNLGANYYIEKTYDAESQYGELRHVIRQVVRHKRMEKALIESEERYRIIFDESPISLWEEDFSDVKRHFEMLKTQGVEDTDSFQHYLDIHPKEVGKLAQMVKIIDVNATTLKLYEARSISEFFEGLTTFFDDEATRLFKEELVALFDGKKVYQGEFPGYKLTGEKMDLIVRLSVVSGYEESLAKVIVSVIDITKTKQVEKTLKESEAKFRTLAEKSPNMIFINKRGSVVYTNKKSEESLGYTYEEFYSPDFDFLCLIAPEHKEKILVNFRRHMKGEEVEPVEYDMITKGGDRISGILTTKIIDFEGERAILGIITDITKYKRTHDDLVRSEERYRRLIELSPDAIILTDVDSKILMVNEQAAKLYGGKETELIGKSAFDFIVPVDRLRALENINLLLTRGNIRNIEYSMIKKDGSTYPADLSVAVISDREGNPTNFLGILRDITERKKAEEKLIRQKEELSEFAHFIAHDLNNCLTSIEGYTQLLDYEYDESHIISKQIEYMKDLLKRSLTLADAGLAVEKDEDVDLNLLIERVASTVIPKTVTFTHDHLPTVHCDQGKLAQVFTNLLENAIIHGDPRTISINKMESDSHLTILVTNDGVPIPPEIQKLIFDYGFSTQDSVGLGLSIVRKIVEAHGWDITVQSGEEGTSFHISIPIQETE